MAKLNKVCRVCGKTYEACRTSKVSTDFRFQDVSCSSECGAEYLLKVQLSRGIKSKKEQELENICVLVEINEDLSDFGFETEDDDIDEFGSDE